MNIRLIELIDIWGSPINFCGVDLQNFVGNVSTDSRSISKGDFFFPIKGINFDGHNFLNDVFIKGAQAAVIDSNYKLSRPTKLLYWEVEDTTIALQQLALFHRKKLGIPVIAITGSVGKTTTKELISAAISPLGSITSSYLNNNNDVGVPLTIIKASKDDAAIVVEMGMRGHGEIKRLSKCSNPDIAIITNIGSAHIGLLGSKENIAKAKCEIVSFLKPDGVVIIPFGDPLLEDALRRVWSGKILRVDISGSDLTQDRMSSCKSNKPNLNGKLHLNFRYLDLEGITFKLPFEGEHNALNFMFALATSQELGIPFTRLKSLNVIPSKGRNNFLKVGDINILDESYNASPESMIASLKYLNSKPSRHIAILGSMLELGNQVSSAHLQVLEYAANIGLYGLITVSLNAEFENEISHSFNKKLNLFYSLNSRDEVFPLLKDILLPGDWLLFKGSRKVGLESVIEELITAFAK